VAFQSERTNPATLLGADENELARYSEPMLAVPASLAIRFCRAPRSRFTTHPNVAM
jgi:hypothetical protein